MPPTDARLKQALALVRGETALVANATPPAQAKPKSTFSPRLPAQPPKPATMADHFGL